MLRMVLILFLPNSRQVSLQKKTAKVYLAFLFKIKIIFMKTTTLFTVSILTSALLSVSANELSLVSSSISKHPNVVEKANEITLKGISLDQILAEDGLKINLSTQSKLPLSFRVKASRLDDVDDTYLNGVIKLQKNLYDFGVVDYKVSAEKSRKEALELEYVQIYETTLQKLLNIANDVSRLNDLLTNLKQNIGTTKSSIEDIKLRFTSGIGTVMDVRQAQLLLLETETETETLQRELSAKLTILNNEFDVSSNQLVAINALIEDFNNELTINRQDVESMIDRVINYQRSIDLINLEKSALNSQINSLKAENLPQLTASLTGVAYDVSSGLDEYELYGGINFSMPLFDSGLSETKKRALSYRIKVQDDITNALNQDKLLVQNKLMKEYQKLKIEKNSAEQKVVNLSEKLSQINQRLSVVDEGLLTKLQTQLQLAQAKRILLAYPSRLQSINIDYWAINEQLLEKMDLRPTY